MFLVIKWWSFFSELPLTYWPTKLHFVCHTSQQSHLINYATSKMSEGSSQDGEAFKYDEEGNWSWND